MKTYLLPHGLPSFKANLHTHTTLSDGVLTPEEVKERYLEQGISIVAFTDHNVLIDHSDLTDERFLALNGYEVDITEKENPRPFGSKKTCHLCFIAKDPAIRTQVCYNKNKYLTPDREYLREKLTFDRDDYERVYSREGVNDAIRLGKENGFYVTYNHPTWSRESWPEYSGYEGMDAMEIWNSACNVLGYPEVNDRVYDDLLSQNKRLFCVAADDIHKPVHLALGWIVLRAPELSYGAVIEALEKGYYYASTGPEIRDLWVEDGTVHVTAAPVREICFSTGSRHAKRAVSEDGSPITEAEFPLKPETDGYFRVTVTDEIGRKAWTNAYWAEEM